MSTPLPPPCTSPCVECPWVRTSMPGWLGPYDAATWVALAHSEVAIACHRTITTESWEDPSPNLRQCAGAAIYRSNIHKLPRNPEVATLPADLDLVFGFNEFEEHHS